MRISDWSSDVCSSDLLVGSGAGWMRRVMQQAHHCLGPLVHRCKEAGRQVERQRQQAQQPVAQIAQGGVIGRSEEHTSELQSLMRISYAVFCLKKKKQ